MSRLRWPDSTNSVSEKPGTIQNRPRCLNRRTSLERVGRAHVVSHTSQSKGQKKQPTHEKSSKNFFCEIPFRIDNTCPLP